MYEGKNTNEDIESAEEAQSVDTAEPAYTPESTETEQPTESTDPFEKVESINVSEPTETTKLTDVESIEKPQSFDMVQPIAVREPVKDTKLVEEIVPTVKPKGEKPAKKHFIKSILTILLVLMLIVAAAGAAYMYRDSLAIDAEQQKSTDITALQNSITKLKTELEAEIAKNEVVADKTAPTSVVSSTSVAPSASVIESIKLSITSGNTAVLEGYMATSVNVVLAVGGAVGSSTPADAVSSVTSFIADATSPWDFALSASVLSSYSNGNYKTYFPSNAVVGKSANNKVISFSFDSKSKINTVFLASSASA